MAPRRAAETFLTRHADAASFRVTLYGSLAATGRGHMTDQAIFDVLLPHASVDLIWQPTVFLPFHPNGMRFESLDAAGVATDAWTVYSIGGGALAEEGAEQAESEDIYPLSKLTDILAWCDRKGRSLWEYVDRYEEDDIWVYLSEVWQAMRESVERGLAHEGVLPGPLNLPRHAPTYYVRASGYKQNLQSRGLVFAYALAVSEENASGGRIVTAPTCGSSGVVPAVLYHLWKSRDFSEARICRALATAGLIGNIVKHNASISGAEVGCQGRSRCRMRHGLGGGQPALRRLARTDRVCRGDGLGAPPRHDLRPGMRTGADSLHRAQRLRCGACAGRQPVLGLYRRTPPRVVRPCGGGNEADRTRSAVDLQRRPAREVLQKTSTTRINPREIRRLPARPAARLPDTPDDTMSPGIFRIRRHARHRPRPTAACGRAEV